MDLLHKRIALWGRGGGLRAEGKLHVIVGYLRPLATTTFDELINWISSAKLLGAVIRTDCSMLFPVTPSAPFAAIRRTTGWWAPQATRSTAKPACWEQVQLRPHWCCGTRVAMVIDRIRSGLCYNKLYSIHKH